MLYLTRRIRVRNVTGMRTKHDVEWRWLTPPPTPSQKSLRARCLSNYIYGPPPMKKLIFLSSHVARVARREDEFEFGEMKQRSSTSLYPRRLEMTSRHCRAYHRKCPLYILHVTGGMQLKVKCYDNICYSKQHNRLAGNVRRLTDRSDREIFGVWWRMRRICADHTADPLHTKYISDVYIHMKKHV